MSLRDRARIQGAARALLAAALAANGCMDPEAFTAEEAEDVVFRALPDAPLPTSVQQQSPSGGAYYGGVVATTEPMAAEAGRAILAKGGNAIDAAVAVQFMSTVVEPQSSGLGGGGFMLIHLAGEPPEKTVVIDFRDMAPGKASLGMLDTSHSSSVKGTSGYTIGVPGTVKGMLYALERYGTLDRKSVLDPAIQAARGFPISSRLAADTGSSRLQLETSTNSYNKGYYAEARKVFRPGGKSLSTGTVLKQPDLEATLKAIATRGADAFYRCKDPSGIAAAIVETQTATRTGHSGGRGRMTCADLENYRLEVYDPTASPDAKHAPLVGEYHGYTVVTAPPPSSGVFLLQMLDMLEALEAKWGFSVGSGNYEFGEYHTLNVMQELMRAAFADRGRWLGDPEFYPVPVQGLLAPSYIQTRAGLISPGKRRSSFSAGAPPVLPSPPTPQKKPGKSKKHAEQEGTDTTHFTVIDDEGNVVTVTSTISDLWGTALMCKGKGFMLNSQLLNFNDSPQGTSSSPAANDVQPYKRPRTTIAPTLLFLDDEVVAAYGSPGGTGILNALFQVTLNLIDHNMGIKDAVQRSRISLDGGGGSTETEIESGFSSTVRSQLQSLGYKFDSVSSIGAVQAILSYPAGGQYGAADSRRIGAVRGLDEH